MNAKSTPNDDLSPELAFCLSFLKEQDSDGNALPPFGVSNGVLHKWTGLYWEPIEQIDLEKQAWEWLAANARDKAAPRTSTSAAAALLLQANKIPVRDDAKCLLPVLNGTIEVGASIVIRDADKNDGLCHIIDCKYDPFAEAPLFTRFLTDVLPDEEVRGYVQEYIGYTLIGDCRFEKSMFWTGSGSNGKSTLAKIIARLHRKVSAMQLDRLDGFALAGLVGASLVVVDETPKKINEQELKKIISGSFIQIERKYRDPLTFTSTAKWLINGNALPAISDQTNGFWRRFSIVRFERQFSEAEQDVLLAKKIIDGELAGVLNWAIEGLQRLLSRGRFPDLPDAMREAQSSGKKESNSVLGFVDDRDIECTESADMLKDAVYAEYSSWCKSNGISPVNSHRFWSRIHEILPKIIVSQRRVNGKKRRFVNLNLDELCVDNDVQFGGVSRG